MSSSVPHVPQKVVYAYGIDLGTIRAHVKIKKPNVEESYKVKLGEDIPSVVSFTDEGKCLVGPFAEKRIVAGALNTFRATKYLIGRNYKDPIVQQVAKNKLGYAVLKSPDGFVNVVSSNINQVFTLSQIAALIFLKLKELCEAEIEVPMRNVVLATPAYFTDAQVKATREAAQMAGLNVLKIMNESEAAVLAYEGDIKTKNKTVVVYDFGGTFKVSVLEIRNGKVEMKSTVSDLMLGGDDFDNVLIDYFVTELKDKTGVDSTRDILSMQWLKTTAQLAKIDLSYLTEVELRFYIVNLRGEVDFIIVKLTRTKFEKLVTKFIDKTIPLCHRALENARISVSNIDDVFAIGGIATIPKVLATVQEIFGKIPRRSESVGRVEAVAVGLALVGYNLASEMIDDKIPSFGISPHIPLPVKQHEKFDYHIGDDLHNKEDYAMMKAEILSTGIVAIHSEEEADSIVRKRLNSQNRIDSKGGGIMECYGFLMTWKRSNTERPLPHDFQGVSFPKFFRDIFVKDELTQMYADIKIQS